MINTISLLTGSNFRSRIESMTPTERFFLGIIIQGDPETACRYAAKTDAENAPAWVQALANAAPGRLDEAAQEALELWFADFCADFCGEGAAEPCLE